MPEKSIRFGVADTSKGLRGSTWKCWTQYCKGKKDVYIACRETKGQIKLSLHQSGRWHFAFDSEKFSAMFDDIPASASRVLGKWSRPAPIIENLTLACRILTPWNAVTILEQQFDSRVTWIVSAPSGYLIEWLYSFPRRFLSAIYGLGAIR